MLCRTWRPATLFGVTSQAANWHPSLAVRVRTVPRLSKWPAFLYGRTVGGAHILAIIVCPQWDEDICLLYTDRRELHWSPFCRGNRGRGGCTACRSSGLLASQSRTLLFRKPWQRWGRAKKFSLALCRRSLLWQWCDMSGRPTLTSRPNFLEKRLPRDDEETKTKNGWGNVTIPSLPHTHEGFLGGTSKYMAVLVRDLDPCIDRAWASAGTVRPTSFIKACGCHCEDADDEYQHGRVLHHAAHGYDGGRTLTCLGRMQATHLVSGTCTTAQSPWAL